MKKLPVSLVLSLVLGTPVCWAQADYTTRTTRTTTVEERSTTDNPWEFSVQGQGIFPADSEANDRFDNTVGGAARLMRDINPYAAIGVEGGWLRFKDEISGVKFGRLDGFPVLGDLELKMPIANNMIVPYFIAGAGVIFWNYDENDSTVASGVKIDNDNNFAAKGGVGVDFYFNDQTALFIEGTYLYSRFEPNITGASVVGEHTNTGSILAGAGLKMKF